MRGGGASVPSHPFMAQCTIENCGNKAFSRGLCRKHYDEVRAQEKADAMTEETEAVEAPETEEEAKEPELREENRESVVKESAGLAGKADVIYRRNHIDPESGALVHVQMGEDEPGDTVMALEDGLHLGDGQSIDRGQTAYIPVDLAARMKDSGLAMEPEAAAAMIDSENKRAARRDRV